MAMTVVPDCLVSETKRLYALLCSEGITVQPVNPDEKPCITGSYDPADGTAVIELCFLADKDWPGGLSDEQTD